jgi:hypothetical protein
MRLVLTLAAALALVAASASLGKEGARARLTTSLPLHAAPGTTIRVGWSLDVPATGGGRRPFGANGVFVRLLSRTGARPTIGFAATAAHSDGRYSARVKVPTGGIGGIRIGLRGWNDSGISDVIFPLQNDPFRTKPKK